MSMPTREEYRLAYLRLLQVTAEPDRSLFCQTALAVLRDTIAEIDGVDPEIIQNSFERKAEISRDLKILNAH